MSFRCGCRLLDGRVACVEGSDNVASEDRPIACVVFAPRNRGRKEGRLELPRVSKKSADTRHPRQEQSSDLKRATWTAGYADENGGCCLLRLGGRKLQLSADSKAVTKCGGAALTKRKVGIGGGSMQKRRLLEANVCCGQESEVQMFWSRAACG
jgi:hypothetical protein